MRTIGEALYYLSRVEKHERRDSDLVLVGRHLLPLRLSSHTGSRNYEGERLKQAVLTHNAISFREERSPAAGVLQ